jgi:PAT family beta-lactamase induction signal transducer AmpG
VGGFIGGYFISHISIYRCLFIFGLLHLISHIFYLIQYNIGYNITLLYWLVAIENIIGGMAMTGYIAYITGLCKPGHAGTQYALFSSIIGASRVVVPSLSGLIKVNFGWDWFFIIAIIIGIPAILLIRKLP